jgi:UDP-2-acetamido-2-deoxy-ribo-hexuluronate aminotransferase
VHYPLPLHRQPAYASLCRAPNLPVAERLAREVVSLPMYADLDDSTQRRITDAVARAVRMVG